MIVQSGSINLAAVQVPGVIVQIVPPAVQPILGLPSNGVGIVGTATWGPVNSPTVVGSYAQYQSTFGPLVNRTYDAGTHVAIAYQQGANNFQVVRVTDGTDTAANCSFGYSGGNYAAKLTALYTGSLGNSLIATMSAGTKASSWKLTVTAPNQVPEIYDNLTGAIAANSVTAGTGYTSVPVLAYSAPQLAGGVQAIGNATLTVVSATGSGGTGYAVNDIYPFANGVTLKITSVSTGAVTGVSVQTGGTLATGTAPTTGQTQTGVGSPGTGTGATFTLTWGVGAPVLTNIGSGYTSATATLTGGGGSSGAYTVTTSIWPLLVNAINLGLSNARGPSQIVAATIGTLTSTAAATGTTVGGTGILTAISGGLDGANPSSSQMVGTDGTGASRTGAYALRGTGIAVLDIADLTDTTQWANVTALAQSESQYPVVSFSAGTSISSVTAAMGTLGIDTAWLKIMHGDWVYWSDTITGTTRVVSPVPFIAGRLGNLVPSLSTLNQPLAAVVGTQKTASNQVYSNADLLALIQARVDVITLPSAGGQNYFAAGFGINSSSNSAINGDNYTRMTNFLAPTLNKAMGTEIGKLQSAQQRLNAYAKMDQFLANLWQQGLIGNASGTYPNGPQPWSITLNDSNNPPARVALGFEQADLKVQYLSVIDNLLINMEAGQSVQISRAPVTNS